MPALRNTPNKNNIPNPEELCLGIGMLHYLKSQEFSDVTFQVRGIEFPAHRPILVSRSPYFRELFLNTSAPKHQVILVENTSPESFLIVLDFIYTDRAKVPFDVEQLHEVLDLTRLYQLRGLEAAILPKFKHLMATTSFQNLPSLWSDLASLYNNETFSDITFIVENEKFFAHKVILASRSCYFRSLLRWNWRESNQQEILLRDIEINTFSVVLAFLYSDHLDISSLPIAQELSKIALFFQVPEMTTKCEEYIVRQSIEPETVCYLWNYAKENQAEALDEVCKSFFMSNFVEISHTSSFLALDRSLLKCALNAGALEVHEKLIFEAIQRWAKARSSNDSELNRELQGLLPPEVMFNQRIKNSLLQIKKFSLVDLLVN